MQVLEEDFRDRCKVLPIKGVFYCLGIKVVRLGNNKWQSGDCRGNWKQVYQAVMLKINAVL